MSKRSGGGLGSILSKKAKEDKRTAEAAVSQPTQPRNPYLSRPAIPEQALFSFLGQVKNIALASKPKGTRIPITEVSYFVSPNGIFSQFRCLYS